MRVTRTRAVELEFYFPATVAGHPATTRLLAELQAIEPGATAEPGAVGLWRGEQEATNVYRVVVALGRDGGREVRARVRAACVAAMRGWGASSKTRQEAMRWVERGVVVWEVKAAERQNSKAGKGGRSGSARPG